MRRQRPAVARCWRKTGKEVSMKRIIFSVAFLALLVVPARAQIVVVDPGNLTQTILIAERTLREYETLVAQYETIVRMSQSLGSLDRYRIQRSGSPDKIPR